MLTIAATTWSIAGLVLVISIVKSERVNRTFHYLPAILKTIVLVSTGPLAWVYMIYLFCITDWRY